MEDQQHRYERARARVQAIKGFYIHASVFVVVNLGLFVINALTSGLAGGVWWFYWPLLGWGIGLGAHALGVFGFGGGGPWGREDRKSTRLNSSHANISYAVFCLKKKKKVDRLLSVQVRSH